MAEFSKTHRAIALSLRRYYCDPQDSKAGAFWVSQHAAAMGAVLRPLNLGKGRLLGHSRRGAVALTSGKCAMPFPIVLLECIRKILDGLNYIASIYSCFKGPNSGRSYLVRRTVLLLRHDAVMMVAYPIGSD